MHLKKSLISAATGLAILGSSLLSAHPFHPQMQMPGSGFSPAPPPWYNPGHATPYPMPAPNMTMPKPYHGNGNNMPCQRGYHGKAANKDSSQSIHDFHMTRMKETIGISEGEDKVWNDFKTMMDTSHAEMQEFMKTMNEERQNTGNPFAAQAKMWDFRQAQHTAMQDARAKLMTQLNEEQSQNMKRIFGIRPDTADVPATDPAAAKTK